MLVSSAFALVLMATPQTPPVPGLCSEPASANVGKPGCYLSTQIAIPAGTEPLFWHIATFDDVSAAQAQAALHDAATVITAHDRVWLYVIGAQDLTITAGDRQAIIGPLHRPDNGPLVVRFLESIFPPGMKTRAHAHPGPEAFYVVEGEQCMDSPAAQVRIGVGESYILEGGPHLQAAPTGRRNLVALLLPADDPWMSLSPQWTPTSYCDR